MINRLVKMIIWQNKGKMQVAKLENICLF